MKTIPFFLLIVFFPSIGNAQIGPVNFIDTTLQSAGVTKFVSADLNNDGYKEIITSQTGSNGKLGYYQNLTNKTFSSFNVIDPFSFCWGVATGDFNNDNWIDLVAIGGIGDEAKIYINNNGSIGSGTQLDSNISMKVNDVVVADFDQNNSDDIVIIGQHSIDLYRNDGSGSFTKEMISSTSTAPPPHVLECLDLATKDMDGDGDMDLITGETDGLVIYINNGNGNFSPNYYSIVPEIAFLIHPMDIDGDGDFDVVSQNNGTDVKWFSNNGSGVMTYEATLSATPKLLSLNSIDYNNDGQKDIYASYLNNISIFENDSNHTFSNEISIYKDTNLIMGAVQIADIDNQDALDYVWSGGNNTIAFHINQSSLSIRKIEKHSYIVFPNPTNGVLNFTDQIKKISLYNQLGKKIMETANVSTINLSIYPTGTYILILENKQGKSFQKIIKN